jgi:hypothetical protein
MPRGKACPRLKINMRMLESSVRKGGRDDLTREKGKGKRERPNYFLVMLVTTPST